MALCDCDHVWRRSAADVNVMAAINDKQQDVTLVFTHHGLHIHGDVLSII